MADRHLDAELFGDFVDSFGCHDTLDDLLYFFLRFLHGFAAGQRETHAPVSRQVVGTGQHEVAHAGEAHEGLFVRAQRDPETSHFVKPTSDQCNSCVRAEAKAITHARADCEHVLVAVPSHGLRETLIALRPYLNDDSRVCWATKGFELHTGKLPHEVAAEELGSAMHVAVLSGPTFAKEVGEQLPTAMTVAANDSEFATELAESLSGDNFRARCR